MSRTTARHISNSPEKSVCLLLTVAADELSTGDEVVGDELLDASTSFVNPSPRLWVTPKYAPGPCMNLACSASNGRRSQRVEGDGEGMVTGRKTALESRVVGALSLWHAIQHE
jgi:hypothetical protein